MVLGIYGAGGLGRELGELAQIINKVNKYWTKIFYILDEEYIEKMDERVINGLGVLSYDDIKKNFDRELEIIVGVGEPIERERLFSILKADNVKIASLIHPNVHIPQTTTVGCGCVIQEGCFISCNVHIGDYVLLQPKVNISHDDVLGSGCVVSGSSNLAGHVHIGENTFLGMNSCIREGISIGNYCIIGMGSVVNNNIDNEMIALGNPAKPIKKNEEKRVFK